MWKEKKLDLAPSLKDHIGLHILMAVIFFLYITKNSRSHIYIDIIKAQLNNWASIIHIDIMNIK